MRLAVTDPELLVIKEEVPQENLEMQKVGLA